jgi:hypothetical protein
MNEQERQVISDIFKRLEQVANEPRDPEAERFIQDRLRAQPYAPYAMAQAIFVQEQALQSLNAQLEALRAEVEETRNRPQGGFLSSLFGGGAREPERPRPSFGQPQPGPWGGPQPGPAISRSLERGRVAPGAGLRRWGSRRWASRRWASPAWAVRSAPPRAAAAAFSALRSPQQRASPAACSSATRS